MARRKRGESRRLVYRYVRERLLAGDPPTVREVQAALGFKAVESARVHLDALIEEGLLEKEPGIARGYRLPATAGGTPTLVPLLGEVPAGPLDLAVETIDEYLPAHSSYEGAEMFALRVEGDSMRDAGILEGDVVIVRRQPTAEVGDVVVARVGDEATVKTFWCRGDRIELRPENPEHEPIRPDPEELVLLGKVVEVRRYLDGPGARGGRTRGKGARGGGAGDGRTG